MIPRPRRLCFFVLAGLAAVSAPLLGHAAPAVSAPKLPRLQLDRLHGPLSVIHVGELRDGGTLTIALADANGTGDGVLFNYKHGSKAQGRLYADGHLLPPGSPEQQIVLAAIGRYLNAQFAPARLAVLGSGTLSAAAHADGDRGYYACRLLRAVNRLEQLSGEAGKNNRKNKLQTTL